MSRLGKLVRELRLQRGFTQVTLAERAGMEQTTLSAVERGKIELPSSAMLHGLADALDVSDCALLEAAGYLRSARGGSQLDARIQAGTALFVDVFRASDERTREAVLAQLRGLQAFQRTDVQQQAQ